MSTIQTHTNYDHSSNSSSEKEHQLNARDLDCSTDVTTESNSISREKLYNDAAENLALEVNRCTASYFSKSYSRSEDQCRAFAFSLRTKYESELHALHCKTPYVNRVSKLVRLRIDSIEKCQWTPDDNAILISSIAPHPVHDQTNTRAPRPALLSNFALPPPRLSYDEWTVLQPRQHGPLPSGILYHCDGERAKIAPTWDIDILGSMIHLFHGNTNQPILNIPYAHTIEDVKRHTTVDMLLKAVRTNLLYHCQHARCDAPTQKDNIDRAISVLLDSQPLQLAIQDQSGLIIPSEYTAATTVEEMNLFHQRARVVITNIPKDTLASSVYFASQGLGNSRPAAQDHGSLLNDLLDADHTKHDSATHLNELSTRDWNKIASFAQKINKIPSCIRFNCGSVEYPAAIHTLCSQGRSTRSNCRAWRVYEPLIRKFAKDHDIPLEECFLSEAVPEKPGFRRVYACSSCRREITHDPDKYDLFDGQTPSTSEAPTSDFGLGSDLDPSLSCLNMHERNAVGLIKMADATFGAYSAYGYASYGGGSELQPADFHGLANLLVSSKPFPKDTNDRRISTTKVSVALQYLNANNSAFKDSLSCFERAALQDESDAFPIEAGGAAPTACIPEPEISYDSDEADETTTDTSSSSTNKRRKSSTILTTNASPALTVHLPEISGLLASVVEIPDSVLLDKNSLSKVTVGVKRSRTSESQMEIVKALAFDGFAPDDLQYPALYPTGHGGWRATSTACSSQHYCKARSKSVQTRFQHADEFIYGQYQN